MRNSRNIPPIPDDLLHARTKSDAESAFLRYLKSESHLKDYEVEAFQHAFMLGYNIGYAHSADDNTPRKLTAQQGCLVFAIIAIAFIAGIAGIVIAAVR